MPRPRSQLVDLKETPYYHCMHRCVRQMYLIGDDKERHRNFDHRKDWIADRIQQLTGIFAAGCCSYGLMSNHVHVVLRMEPEIAAAWDVNEVADRYGALFAPTVKMARKLPADLFERKVMLWRERLVNLSWFMRCLAENIARRANKEDGCKGRFWDGRFRSTALLDDEALMTCMAYVDLNPIRAGIAESLEDSGFTSIRERLIAAAKPAGQAIKEPWLLPFADQATPLVVLRSAAHEPAPAAPSKPTPARIAPLPMAFEDYEELLRWTVADLKGKRQQPLPRPRAFQKSALNPENFVETIQKFAQRFFTMAGSSQRIGGEATRRGYKRSPGITGARRMYRDSG